MNTDFDLSYPHFDIFGNDQETLNFWVSYFLLPNYFQITVLNNFDDDNFDDLRTQTWT